MLTKMKNLVMEEEGQGLTEYALLIAGIVVVIGLAVTALSEGISNLFGDLKTKLMNA